MDYLEEVDFDLGQDRGPETGPGRAADVNWLHLRPKA